MLGVRASAMELFLKSWAGVKNSRSELSWGAKKFIVGWDVPPLH